MSCCHGSGPGYASPAEAIKSEREKTLLVTSPHVANGPDAIFSIDVDPNSPNFMKVLSRVDMPNINDEVHHTGWNSCSSCHGDSSYKRTHLIVPCLYSDRVYIVDARDANDIKLEKTIEAEELHKHDVSFPHTSHCLADGNILISTLGNNEGDALGNFLLLDGKTFNVKGRWTSGGVSVPFNYGFWYQPRRDIMISSEWGAPNVVKKGFHMEDVIGGKYGHSLHVFRWSTHERIQTIELPVEDGSMPLELKFLHEPTSEHAFVGCALGSTVYHLHPKYNNTMDYQATDVINIASKKVEGWMLPLMPALITDILVSMDDRMLYVSCWLHGDIRQYDISNPAEPNLVGQVYIGGSIHDESGVTVVGENAPKALYVKRTKIEGGPHLMQLSLDGKRMYVTTSLNNAWDEQFYPNLRKVGATMVLLDINPTGGMKINQDFLVEFGKLPGGPYLAHEMRFPGGDCTSDIWI